MTPPLRTIAALVFAMAALPACATTIDETRPGGAQATTAEVPEPAQVIIPATTADRLNRIEALSLGLGERIAAGSGRAVAAEIDAIWAATRPTIQRDEPIVVLKMDAQFELIGRAVEFKRGADADKAGLNLRELFADYLAKHSG